MNEPTARVVDLLVGDNTQPQSVSRRIEQRLVILRAWLADGIPMGKTFPRSLNAARLWEDDELGIWPVRSPNDFTTTHSEYGKSVKQVGELLTALSHRYGRPKKGSPVKSRLTSKFEQAEFDRALMKAVSQWHAERDQRLTAQVQSNSSKTLTEALLAENAEKDRIIAQLRRQLSAQTGLRAVE